MLNLVTLMGRLCADPELKHTPNGVNVTTFTIAVERDYTPKGAEKQTDFIDLVAWRNTADFISQYFHKGNMIAVTGALQTRSYTDKNGNNRKAVEVVVDKAHFCGSKEHKADTNLEDFAVVENDEDLPF